MIYFFTLNKSAAICLIGLIRVLFTDTEARKDRIQHIFVGDFTGDGAELFQGRAQINGKEIPGHALLQRLQGALHILLCLLERITVTAGRH